MLELVSKLNAEETENTVAEHGYAHRQETTGGSRETGVYVEGKQGYGFRAGYFSPDGDWYAEASPTNDPMRILKRLAFSIPNNALAYRFVNSGYLAMSETTRLEWLTKR